MRSFQYPCPGCRSTSNLHEDDCQHSNHERDEIEAAYFDILTQITYTSKDKEGLQGSVEGSWTGLYEDCMTWLVQSYIIAKDSEGGYRVLGPEERKEAVSEPQYDPMKTLYEHGSVKGAHDNGVFAMIAFYEFAGLSWPETREKVVDWLEESGAWERGGFAERSPEELVDKKRHVYEQGYGWKEKAESAKRTIERELGKA